MKTAKGAAKWLTGNSEGVVAKQAEAQYLPGERKGMVKIKRMRTADAVVAAFRYGKEEGTAGLADPRPLRRRRRAAHRGPHLGLQGQGEARAAGKLEPYMTGESGPGEPSRWKSDEELVWQGLQPELVVEVTYDHVTGNRIRHGTKLLRWREDKAPRECLLDQLRE